jgi:hypothetical protein
VERALSYEPEKLSDSGPTSLSQNFRTDYNSDCHGHFAEESPESTPEEVAHPEDPIDRIRPKSLCIKPEPYQSIPEILRDTSGNRIFALTVVLECLGKHRVSGQAESLICEMYFPFIPIVRILRREGERGERREERG